MMIKKNKYLPLVALFAIVVLLLPHGAMEWDALVILIVLAMVALYKTWNL